MPICDSKPMTRLTVCYLPTNKLTGKDCKQGEHNSPKALLGVDRTDKFLICVESRGASAFITTTQA